MTEVKNTQQISNNKLSAVVLGGTGGVGAYLVKILIDSRQYSKVTVISRRKLSLSPKLNVVVWEDFSKKLLNNDEKALEVFKNHDVVFCCLGAPEKALIGLLFNKKKYGEMFQTVDHNYVVAFASLAHKAGVPQFSVISSPTANPKAKFLYSKIKGEMEQAVKSFDFKGLSFFQPYHLMKPAKEKGSFVKKALKNTIAFIASLMPAKQKAIKVEDVATAMKLEFDLRLGEKIEKIRYYDSDSMRKLLKNEMTVTAHHKK